MTGPFDRMTGEPFEVEQKKAVPNASDSSANQHEQRTDTIRKYDDMRKSRSIFSLSVEFGGKQMICKTEGLINRRSYTLKLLYFICMSSNQIFAFFFVISFDKYFYQHSDKNVIKQYLVWIPRRESEGD